MNEFLCQKHECHDDIIALVNDNLPNDCSLSKVADLFKVFGDYTRIRIICVLFSHEMCVCDIAKLLSMNQSAISHQLRVLKQADLVKCRRDGKSIFYSLSDDHVKTIFDCALSHVEE